MERKVRKILTVADKEIGLSCTAYSPLQCPVYFYYAYTGGASTVSLTSKQPHS